MRCKVGDLAVVVKSPSGKNLGIFLRLVRVDAHGDWIFKDASRLIHTELGYYVRNSDDCFPTVVVHDSWLMPIRDQPGEDETLAWCPVPGQTVEVAA